MVGKGLVLRGEGSVPGTLSKQSKGVLRQAKGSRDLFLVHMGLSRSISEEDTLLVEVRRMICLRQCGRT